MQKKYPLFKKCAPKKARMPQMSKMPNAKAHMWFVTGIMMKRIKIIFKRLVHFILQISLAFTEFQHISARKRKIIHLTTNKQRKPKPKQIGGIGINMRYRHVLKTRVDKQAIFTGKLFSTSHVYHIVSENLNRITQVCRYVFQVKYRHI